MTKKELSEIKKLYAQKDCSIRQMAGAYINADGEILSTFGKTFLNLPDEEIYKYLEMLKKGLTGTLGKNIVTMDLSNESQRAGMANFLLKLKETDLKNNDMLMRFYEQCASAYGVCQNICVLLIRNVYDVIHRNDDGVKDMDGADEVYDYLQCLVIAVKLEEPGLAYNKDDGSFIHKETRWCLDKPVCGFIYPSFEERSSDCTKITVYTKKADGSYMGFFHKLLDTQEVKSAIEQQEDFTRIIETVVQGNENGIQIAANLQKGFVEKAEEGKPGELLNLTKDEISDILSSSGMNDEDVKIFEKAYEEQFKNEEIAAQNVINLKELQIKTPDIVIRVKNGKMDVVSVKEIDGTKCIVIQVAHEEKVNVNGIILERKG